MHYHDHAFSLNSGITIESWNLRVRLLETYYQNKMQNTDAVHINSLYCIKRSLLVAIG